MNRATISKNNAINILASCIENRKQSNAIRAIAKRLGNKPRNRIDGALVSELIALALGDAGSWERLIVLRPDCAEMDRRDLVLLTERIFAEEETESGRIDHEAQSRPTHEIGNRQKGDNAHLS